MMQLLTTTTSCRGCLPKNVHMKVNCPHLSLPQGTFIQELKCQTLLAFDIAMDKPNIIIKTK